MPAFMPTFGSGQVDTMDGAAPPANAGFAQSAGIGTAAPQAPPAMDMRKMMLAQALMGGGGQSGPPPTTFAGGMAQGASPMLHAMMMQRMGMMGGQNSPPQMTPPTAPPMPGLTPPAMVTQPQY